jgi:hypothetical protein
MCQLVCDCENVCDLCMVLCIELILCSQVQLNADGCMVDKTDRSIIAVRNNSRYLNMRNCIIINMAIHCFC